MSLSVLRLSTLGRAVLRRNGLPRRLLSSLPFMTGVVLILLVVGLMISSWTVLSGDPMAMVGRPFLAPGADPRFPLGTDMLGRDILVLLAHGARISLLVGICSAAIALVIGLTIGLLAGYFGGIADRIFTIFTELFQTLPQLLLAIVLVAVLTPSVWSVIVAVGITSWTGIARIVRPEVMRLRRSEFVQAAEIAGAGPLRILLTEILPNILSSVVILTSILIAGAILTEAALSFLGLGDPNVVSWGGMIGVGRTVLRDAWYISAFPGLATLITVLGFSFLANGLNDALNRRLAL